MLAAGDPRPSRASLLTTAVAFVLLASALTVAEPAEADHRSPVIVEAGCDGETEDIWEGIDPVAELECRGRQSAASHPVPLVTVDCRWVAHVGILGEIAQEQRCEASESVVNPTTEWLHGPMPDWFYNQTCPWLDSEGHGSGEVCPEDEDGWVKQVLDDAVCRFPEPDDLVRDCGSPLPPKPPIASAPPLPPYLS